VFEDPHYAARGTIVRAEGGDVDGPVAMPAPVPRLSATPGRIRHAGGAIGQDTASVLREMLAMGDEELARLQASGAVYDAASTAHVAPAGAPA
jgi:crotonobetainyl-CoA:carnitine CoA-transferase CaiB-like acyl-CoA transferase